MPDAQHWKQRAIGVFWKTQRLYHTGSVTFNRFTHTVRRLAMRGAYWGAVCVVGIAIAAVILHINHVPIAQPAYAGAGGWVGIVLGNMLYYVFIGPIGMASALVAFIMQLIINYPHGAIWSSAAGGFVNVSAVQTGWKLVRDVCNMFFSLILVIIALATVLKIEAYSWKVMVPKLVLMAVLINFSKTICGVFTDMATVAMATFGGSFGESFALGIIGAFGLPTLVDLGGTTSVDESSLISTMLAYVAAAVMTMIFFVIMLSFTATLLFRIVMLWFLIVLSPLAYISRILPQTKKYSSEWWEMFGRYVTVGPLVTFFLWLSLTMAFGTSVGGEQSVGDKDANYGNPVSVRFATSGSAITSSTSSASSKYTAPSGSFAATSPNVLANFLVATMLLMASLKLIHKMAAEAGAITGAIEGKAWGVGAGLFAMPGIGMQYFGAGMGSMEGGAISRALFKATHREVPKIGHDGKPEVDKDGNPVMQWQAGRFAQIATTLGSTVFQPVDWGKGVIKARKELFDEKKAIAKNRAEHEASRMRGVDVAGKGAVLGVMANLAGLAVGAGLDPTHVAREYLSLGGITRILGKRGRLKNEEEAKKLDTQQEEEEKKAREARNRLRTDEVNSVLDEHDANREAVRTLNGVAAGIAAGQARAEIDARIGEVKVALQGEIRKMEDERQQALNRGDVGTAEDLGTQIELLQGMVKDGEEGSTTYDALEGVVGAGRMNAMRDSLSKAVRDRAGDLEKKNEALQKRLADSGYTGALNPVTGYARGGTLTNAVKVRDDLDKDGKKIGETDEREDHKKAADALKKQAAKLRTELAAYQEPTSYEARTHTEHLIQEEMSKIKDVKNTTELMGYLARAKREGNHHLYEAVVKRIAQNYDFNEIIQQQMADAGYTDARSDADGLELWRQRVLVGQLGMSEHESLRLANDLSYIEEGVGHIGASRAYEMVNGHLHFIPEARRAKLVAGEMRKADINAKLKWNRLAWGYEDHNRDFHLSKAGLEILLTDADAFSAPRKWENMAANTKLRLSNPKVVDELRKAGVSSKFIALLQDYWDNVGQYEHTGAIRRGSSRLAVYEEDDATASH